MLLKKNKTLRLVLSLVCLLSGSARLGAQGGVFTVQVGTAPPLVGHGDTWYYHKGTNAPQADWQTTDDEILDSTWAVGPGGFGFGDPGIVGEATTLNDMLNGYSTFYIRKMFDAPAGMDTNAHLRLTVDYDDGFVAYLNGVELQRANTTNGPGTVVTHTATTGGVSHEASCCNAPVNTATNYDLGPVGNRLPAATHVFAVIGINQARSSSDFHLIADLSLSGSQGGLASGVFFTLVASHSVNLSGSNTLAGSTRVVINGVDANYDAVAGTWSKTQPLSPGMNRLFIAALDGSGAILTSTNKDIVSEVAATTVGGTLAGNATWTSAMGIIRVTNDLIVPAGVRLSIGEGVVVLLSPAASIRAQSNGVIDVVGADNNPVHFLPADGTTMWRELSANGANAALTLRHAEVVNGQVIALTNAIVTVEDSVLRDYVPLGRLFVSASRAAQLTLRRTHVARYDQCRFAETPVLIEGCLIEQISSDSTDFADHPNVTVRRTTYRRGQGGNTDAIDLGGNPGMVVDSCLIHDFPDKGVSIADFSPGTIVSNTLIYHCGSAISAYTASNCVFANNTIADSGYGIILWDRRGQGPGHGFGTNNIVWGNSTNLSITNTTTLALTYSDIEATIPYPGVGNINLNPLFADAARGDYRLDGDSPARGAGQGGADMGVHFPVGGIPSAPFNLAARALGTNTIQLTWQEDADNETAFAIDRSTNATAWQALDTAGANVTNYTDATAVFGQPYFYRVQATNTSGHSRCSNLASATRQVPTLVVNGGTLTSNTIWSPALGTILVTAPLTVPSNLSLTIEAGSVIKLTNSGALRAQAGGTINVAGAEDNPVSITGVNLGGLAASGSNAFLTIRHADLKGACVGATNGATMLVEDTYLHEYKNGGYAIGGCENAREVTVRGCHFNIYHETLWRFGVIHIEDTLFENANNPSSDALDFDGTLPGTFIRRCTFRHGPQSNTDAIDLGSETIGCVVEDCLMYDFPNDKGVSIGEDSHDIVIRNCLMYGVSRGVQVKDVSTTSVYGNTIVDSDIGLHCYEKIADTGGGQITNSYNNILWNNGAAITIETNSILVVNYTDTGGTNWPGLGNLNADPLFLNAAQRDYRLQPDSPCLGTGRDGETMGCRFPVGAPMAPSHPYIDSLSVSSNVAVIRFWADSERSYTLQGGDSLEGGKWGNLTNVPTRSLPVLMKVTDSLAGGSRFYRLVSPQQP